MAYYTIPRSKSLLFNEDSGRVKRNYEEASNLFLPVLREKILKEIGAPLKLFLALPHRWDIFPILWASSSDSFHIF